MLKYNNNLKGNARDLRHNMTDSEKLLWSRIRRKQILDTQFYRQKPIGNYIVDFYSANAKLVIEIDGSQHFEPQNMERDKVRDSYLNKLGLLVLRFDTLEVLKNTDAVLEKIFSVIESRLNKHS